jgi:Flp pilus assembly pilin Flp
VTGDDGVTVVEYGVIVATFVLVVIGAVAVLTGMVSVNYAQLQSDVGSPHPISTATTAPGGLTCTGGTVPNGAGTACVTLAQFCAETSQIPNHAANGCVANQTAFCSEVSQIPNHAGTGCVTDIAAFCAEVSQIPNHAGTGCVTDMAAFCAEVSQVLNPVTNLCENPAPVCASNQTLSNGSCVTLPVIGRCYQNINSQGATYTVLTGYSPTPVLVSVTDPGLSGDTAPALSGSNTAITYTTPNRDNRWPANGKITITFTFSVAYTANGVPKTGTQTGSFTITRVASGGNSSPTGSNC